MAKIGVKGAAKGVAHRVLPARAAKPTAIAPMPARRVRRMNRVARALPEPLAVRRITAFGAVVKAARSLDSVITRC